MERTFAIIKRTRCAGALNRGDPGALPVGGFTVRAMRLQHLTKRDAEGSTRLHQGRPFRRGAGPISCRLARACAGA
jgi:nucleoside diphosphate kinase